MVGYHPEPINGQLPLTSAEYSEAGLLSGIVTRVIIQPLDVLKIRFQLQEEPIRGKTSGKYKGVLQSIFLIAREEGAAAFWKGHIPAQGLSAMYGLVQFSSFEWLSRQAGFYLPNDDQALRSSSDFACGALSGCLAMTAAMPLDVIRTRLVAQKSGSVVYTGTGHAIKYIWQKEGVAGYFRGWIPSVAQIAPYTGMQFSLYNFFMELWPFDEKESAASLTSGAMAGTVAKTILYPLDMVRHRLQMRGFERTGFGKTSDYNKGLLKTVAMVVRNEDWYGLFKGLWPSQIKAAANSGCVLVSSHAAAMTASKLFFGVAADRSSNVKLLTMGSLGCATLSICLGFSSSCPQIIMIMLFIGGLQGAGWVPATKCIARWFNDSSYATMFSILGCASTLAGLLLPIFKHFYWRTIELNFGLAVIVMVAFARWLLRFDLQEVRNVDGDEKKANASAIGGVVKSTAIWHIALIYFFSMEMRTICETWIPLYLTDNQMSADGFQVAYELGGMIGTVASGLFLDGLSARIGVDTSRKFSGVLFSCLMMLCAIGVFEISSLATIFGFITGFLVNGSINIWCLIGSQCGNSSNAGACSAFISFVATSGSVFAGSPLANLIAHNGYGVFKLLLLAQILFVLSISALRLPLKMSSSKGKTE
ncbi:unnamed protein product [Caenorhabditis bovis]|uniref:Major facilitator superfamily (MFS) profile domain-containing protein n=1 Tax=Caenorhabditis bovis TaxID=2654633 RepID=A0A8S1F3A8_9PELO|nr:unnamed protein product [Caenorhabditis bovis]